MSLIYESKKDKPVFKELCNDKTFKEFLLVIHGRSATPVLTIRKGNKYYKQIWNMLKDTEKRSFYKCIRLVHNKNDITICTVSYRLLNRSKWESNVPIPAGTYQEDLEKRTIKKGRKNFIFGSTCCLDDVLLYIKNDLLKCLNDNNVSLYEPNSDRDDAPKNEKEIMENISKELTENNNAYWWIDGEDTSIDVKIINTKLPFEKNIIKNVPGHFNELLNIRTPKKNIKRMLSKCDGIYLTHDNGDRPFCVHITWNVKKENYKVKIFKYRFVNFNCNSPNGDTSDYPKQMDVLVKKYVGLQILEGMDTINKPDKKYDFTPRGNSVLVRIGDLRYVYIGDCIYEFTTQEPIKMYHSVVGNNDVPYPVAVGKNYLYFMLDRVQVLKKDIKCPKKDYDNAYSYYYGHKGGVRHGPGIRSGRKFQDIKNICLRWL